MVAEPGGEPEIVTVNRVPVALVREEVPVDQLAAFFDRAFPVLAEELERQQIGLVGPAVALFHGAPGETTDAAVGFPVQRPAADAGPVIASALPAGRVARVVHTGGYDGLPETYARLQAFAADRGVDLSDTTWESYLTEPEPGMDPARLLTEVSWLLRS